MGEAGVINLAGNWNLSDEFGEFRTPIVVPNDVISGLRDAGLIPEPYYGQNEYDLRWIADRDWTVSREFQAEAGQYELAIEYHDKAIAEDPNRHEVYVNRGVVYRLMGDYDKAEASYAKALELEPDYAEPHASLGALAIFKGEYGRCGQTNLRFWMNAVQR